MLIIRRILLLLCLTILLSCDNRKVHSEYDRDFPENRWQRATEKRFEFDLKDAGKYDLAIDFRHVYGMPFGKIPLEADITSPNGNVAVYRFDLELLDKNGSTASDCTSDYCDLQQVFIKGQRLEAGKYTVTFRNLFQHDYLPNVMGLGIQVLTSDDQ